MGLVQAVHRTQALEYVVRDPVHDLFVPAVHDRVQPAERAQARGRAGAAEEPIALDQERGAAAAPGRERGRDAGGAAPRTTTSYSPNSGVLREGSVIGACCICALGGVEGDYDTATRLVEFASCPGAGPHSRFYGGN